MLKDLISSSFRDPSGFVYKQDDKIYRQINQFYKKEYDHLMSCGLYEELTSKGFLVPHQELELNTNDEKAYKIIEPEKIPFISYASEWSFSQLKSAALATINAQLLALKYNMSLKDANTYNVQFKNGKPILIDTLSFDFYEEGKPWVAYRQFCQHFLAPLALMAKIDVSLNQLLRTNIDGVPLMVASKMLPLSTKLSPGLLLHIHMHAKSQKKHEGEEVISKTEGKMPKNSLISLLNNLKSTVKSLKWEPTGTQWGDYYTFTNYSDSAFDFKKNLISKFIDKVQPRILWDLGGNIGTFSRIAVEKGINTYCFDIDPAAVEKNYQYIRKNKEQNHTPLLMDLTNPTSARGWANEEWMSFKQRGPADICMALAIIHHLSLGNNLPFIKVANHFADLCNHLIIEFVPKTDSQVVKLMQNRDINPDYNIEHFEKCFGEYFEILEKSPVEGSERTLYLMKKRSS